ncbi:hypothetical protein BT63DRAFT_427494 [Microthyrium microscopicum]|uniref:Mediator of RNA polymerase II transcription subunit 9 n=1 Tax=Microthyrium microscopicum TaxID=703497 RepID=A0A6A6U608_9PEZI|nr:hypothetical protein BT63DRAFT_427494 [Microthyrium microscopicum]
MPADTNPNPTNALPSPSTPLTARTPLPPPAPTVTLDDINPYLLDVVPQVERLINRVLLPAPPPGSTPTPITNNTVVPTTGHLDTANLEAAANPLRVNIQKSQEMLKQLPDMDRSVEDQQAEIKWLEERIGKMVGMLGGLRDSADAGAREHRERDGQGNGQV